MVLGSPCFHGVHHQTLWSRPTIARLCSTALMSQLTCSQRMDVILSHLECQ